MRASAGLLAGLCAVGLVACDGAPATPPVDSGGAEGLDAGDASLPDAAPPDGPVADGPRDAAAAADVPLEPDAAPECPAMPALVPTEPIPPGLAAAAGVDEVDRPHYERLRDHLLADPGVLFLATLDRTSGRYVVETAAGAFEFRRSSDNTFIVEPGVVTDLLGETDPDLLPTVAAEEGAANPDSYPLPLLRIATVFDAPDAPDALVDLKARAAPSAGSHGSLAMLQSRATLVLSGAGARRGVELDEAASLVDVAPTVMAALGAPTTGGLGPDGVHEDGLHLRWQDGRVLWEALTCQPAERAVVILFDGLVASELARQGLDEDAEVELPTFRSLLQDGVVWRTGAVAGFPSLSAPGHTTVGTGLWPGHHNVLGNAFWGRAEAAPINPFVIADDPQAALADPSIVWDFYERAVHPEAETLSQAVHRAFGPEAFAVVINEIAIGGADLTTFDLLAPQPQKIDLTAARAADALATGQVETVLRRNDLPVPKLLQLSLVATDSAGERHGPHSDEVREVLRGADAQLARIRAAYEARGALEGTLFVLVADHGMERQDPDRRVDVSGLVASSGVKTRLGASRLVYLPTLDVTRDGDGVLVTDRDNGSPVVGVTLRCLEADCGERTTDEAGRAPAEGLSGPVEASHRLYNARTLTWD